MFGIGLWEMIVVGVVALLAFGPEQLPELARKLGKLSGELRKNTDGLRREFYNSVYTPAREVERTARRSIEGVKESARQLILADPSERSTTSPVTEKLSSDVAPENPVAEEPPPSRSTCENP